MDYVQDLERRIRERGVRVEERLELLRLLAAGSEGLETLVARRRRLAEAVRAAGEALREEASR
jgi:hypothetical protein